MTSDRNRDVVRESLIWLLEDFADFDRTVREWRSENAKVRRSYDEDISLFFDTYEAEHFAAPAECASLGFTAEQCVALANFVRLLADYDERTRHAGVVTSERVISDPTWRAISKAAAETLAKLEDR